MSLFSLSLIFFIIIDPMGNLMSYRNLLQHVPEKRRFWVGLRELSIALAVMLLFNGIGEILFALLGFCESALRIASGIIIFLIALKILFPGEDAIRTHLPSGEPFVFPLAVPLLAGPGLLATIMLYAHLEPSQPHMIAAILLAWGASSLVFLFSSSFYKVLGENGLAAFERLTAMVLVLLAIQRVADGLQLFVTGKCQ